MPERVFRKIGLAIAFSPRISSLLAEAARLKKIWNAELNLIHVGEKTREDEILLEKHLLDAGLDISEGVKLFWEKGNAADRILAVCKKEQVDLLIAGALKKEKLIQYYLGTVARKILRRANCSVLLLIDPSIAPKPIENIVVNADNSNFVREALQITCSIARTTAAKWLHIVREIKMYGLTMSATDNVSAEEYEEFRQSLVRNEIDQVQQLMRDIPHGGLKINIKIVSGKSGFELSRFAHRKQADLLVVGAPRRRFSIFDRVFPNDLEYVFADLPCDLLVVNPARNGKENSR